MTQTLREQVARLIDPSSWRVMDSYLEQAKRKYAGQDAGYDPDAFKDSASLARADAILALVQPAGWKLAPVDPTQEMLREGGDVLCNRFGLRDDILVIPMAVQGVYRAMLAAAPEGK